VVKKLTIDDYIKSQDWDSAIAACTNKIDDPQMKKRKAHAYYCRGYARCFVSTKDEDYKKAISDLSTALQYIQNNSVRPCTAECCAKRAYAYWLNANYERAMEDCKRTIRFANKKQLATQTPTVDDIKAFSHELLGSIYSATGYPIEAVREFKEALKLKPFSFSLLERYREACKKIREA
jgi:tetratricopeptide (TPR) repeat protein